MSHVNICQWNESHCILYVIFFMYGICSNYNNYIEFTENQNRKQKMKFVKKTNKNVNDCSGFFLYIHIDSFVLFLVNYLSTFVFQMIVESLFAICIGPATPCNVCITHEKSITKKRNRKRERLRH